MAETGLLLLAIVTTGAALYSYFSYCRKGVSPGVSDGSSGDEVLQALRESEGKFRTLFDSANDAIFIHGPEGSFLEVNRVACESLGYTRDELLKLTPADISGQKGLTMKPGRLDVLRREGILLEAEHLRKDGTSFPVELSSCVIEFGGRSAILSIARDLSPRKEFETELKETNEVLRSLITSSPLGIVAIDLDGRITNWNPAAERIFGWKAEEVIGKIVPAIPDENLGSFSSMLSRTVKGEEQRVTELRRRRKDGTTIYVDSVTAPVRDAYGNITRAMAIITDVTEKKLALERVTYLSYHDKLTGLFNRAFFEEELERLDAVSRYPLSIILGDMNGLKLVNDVFGHPEGDKLLIRVSTLLEEASGPEAIVCRWGGDEFAVLLPNTSQPKAGEVMARIRQRCAVVTGTPVQVSIALGVATKEESNEDFQGLIKDAENRMYRRKLLESRSVRNSLIASLEKTLEEKTHETEEHGQRLAELALALGQALDLSADKLDELSLLARLHDIGKMAIPDELLSKPAPLSESEWETLKTHCEVGYRIARSSHDLMHIADAILSHHERWNGTGYPRGIVGEDIPLIARIIAIVDAYDVMTHQRPYKEPISPDEALREIKRCSGTQFCPDLVERFCELMTARDRGSISGRIKGGS